MHGSLHIIQQFVCIALHPDSNICDCQGCESTNRTQDGNPPRMSSVGVVGQDDGWFRYSFRCKFCAHTIFYHQNSTITLHYLQNACRGGCSKRNRNHAVRTQLRQEKNKKEKEKGKATRQNKQNGNYSMCYPQSKLSFCCERVNCWYPFGNPVKLNLGNK